MTKSIKRRPCLRLESLEGREVPAVSIAYAGGNLTLTGDQVANNLTVKAVADNQVQVLNQVGANPAVNFGTFNLTGKLTVLMGNSADQFTLDLGDKTFGGSVYFSTGSGNDAVSLNGNGANINGPITGSTSNGDDAVFFSGVGLLTVGGNVSCDMGLGLDSFLMFGGAAHISGNLNVTNGNFVASDIPCDIAGNMIVSTSEPVNNVIALGINIGGSLIVTTAGGNDLVRLNEGGSVAGNVTANLGAGNDSYQQGSGIGPTGTFDVGGSVSVIAGTGNDNFQIGNEGATIFGNLGLNGGDGDNTFNLAAGCTIAGSLTLSAGNGNDNVTVDTQVAGNANFAVGNGANSATISQAPLGLLTWTSGGGGSQLTLGSASSVPGIWNVSIYFGGGADTFTLSGSAGSQFIRGVVDGGAGTDTFMFDPNWTFDPTFRLINF